MRTKSRCEAGIEHGKDYMEGMLWTGARTGGIIKGLERRIKAEILERPGVPTVVTDPPS